MKRMLWAHIPQKNDSSTLLWTMNLLFLFQTYRIQLLIFYYVLDILNSLLLIMQHFVFS